MANDDVVLAWAAPAIRLSVRADTHAAATVGMALGVLLGSAPCRAVITRQRTALWLGPDEWLVLAPDNDQVLLQQLVPVAASIVDVSHGFAGIDVVGPRAAWCINAFNALDLDVSVFPVTACARTVFGKAQIVLWRVAVDWFRIDTARSFAPYVWAGLEAARREFLPAPTAC